MLAKLGTDTGVPRAGKDGAAWRHAGRLPAELACVELVAELAASLAELFSVLCLGFNAELQPRGLAGSAACLCCVGHIRFSC